MEANVGGTFLIYAVRKGELWHRQQQKFNNDCSGLGERRYGIS